ncbi:helix-turn-helix domain-containing protein [Streptomyces alboflavus]|uniref:helix-turn-helix domain-containing protein n=1 Tax=Streptomyces alboflavus TaxID=67267 RepID=UPI001F02C455|nr:helix-turn-helix domain-containing protein [Streptomyces alboflavus]
MAGRPYAPLDPALPSEHRELVLTLRDLREDQEITLDELSARTRFSSASLSRALSGRQLPSRDLLEALCDGLGTPAEARKRLRLLHDAAAAVRLTDHQASRAETARRGNRQSRAGIRDVAAAAGVSITTVSDALNGKGRLPDATRRHIREVADRLGYRPSAAARTPATPPDPDLDLLRRQITELHEAAGKPTVRSLEAASGVPRSAVHRFLTGSFSHRSQLRPLTDLTDVLVSLIPPTDREDLADVAQQVRNTLAQTTTLDTWLLIKDTAVPADIAHQQTDAHERAADALRRLTQRAIELEHRHASGQLTAEVAFSALLQVLRSDIRDALQALSPHTPLASAVPQQTSSPPVHPPRAVPPQEPELQDTAHEVRAKSRSGSVRFATKLKNGPADVDIIPALYTGDELAFYDKVAAPEPSDTAVEAHARAVTEATHNIERALGQTASPDTVQRAMRLLEAAASHEDGAPAKQLARAAEIPLPTAYHLLRVLTHEGYLHRNQGVFTLGEDAKELGRAAQPPGGSAAR